jgi:hypothetical protein
MAAYKHWGVAAIETPGKGGRRHQYLTLEQERAFLQPFLARAARGEMPTAAEIKLAFEAETKQSVAPSTIYRLLDRHGWRQLGVGASSAQPASESACGNTVSAPERRELSPPKGKSASSNTGSVPERRKPAPTKTNRELPAQGY